MSAVRQPEGDAVYLSMVIPVFNEEESLRPLCAKIHSVVERFDFTSEIVFVDDGSTDSSFAVIEELHRQYPEIRAVRFRRNHRKAAALATGFKEARGQVIVTMDADLQDDPAEIPRLVAKLQEGWDLVSGWKQARKDSFVKNTTSKLYNGATSLATGIKLHDHNCGLKIYRREVCDAVRLYGEMHRYVPAQAHLQGFRVAELPVRHERRKHGVTKYGASRFLNGFLDLLTVVFLANRSSSPLHFFGRMGLGLFIVGGGILGWFLTTWLLGHGLRIRPLLLLGVTLVILAVQFVSLGLVAELVVAGHKPEAEYRVRRRI